MNAAPQWTSGLNLKTQESTGKSFRHGYLDPEDIFWSYSSLICFQGLQARPCNHHPIVGAQPGRREDRLHVEVLGKVFQSLPHSQVACHPPRHHQVGRQPILPVEKFASSLDSFCQMFQQEALKASTDVCQFLLEIEAKHNRTFLC